MLILYGLKIKVKIVCLKKYDISNAARSAKDEFIRRKKKWGFGKVYTNELVDIIYCAQQWQLEKIKIYPEENIYSLPLEIALSYIKKYRSINKFLSSWWVDENLNRPLTGEEKWEYLKLSMEKYGWDPLQPACIRIRSIKPPIIVNGHHRIAIAHHLNINNIPINFLYS